MNALRFGTTATLSVSAATLAASTYSMFRQDTAARTDADRPFSEYDVILPHGKKRLAFVLFYWGSRGDLQPLCVLAKRLKDEGHTVLINVRERYRNACFQLGLEESDLYLQEDDRPEDTLAAELQGLEGPPHASCLVPAHRRSK